MIFIGQKHQQILGNKQTRLKKSFCVKKYQNRMFTYYFFQSQSATK